MRAWIAGVAAAAVALAVPLFVPGLRASAETAAPQAFAVYSDFGARETNWRWPVLSHLAIFSARIAIDPLTGVATVVQTDFWRGIAREGEVAALREAARANGVPLLLTVTNVEGKAFSRTLAHDVVATAAARASAVGAIVAEALGDGRGDGVLLDFEKVAPSDRDAFTAFVAELAAAVHAGGGQLFVALPGRRREDLYDTAALAAVADGLFLMTFVSHTNKTDPGPLSPLVAEPPWQWSISQGIDDYLSAGASPEKLIPSFEVGGYEWPAASADVGAPRVAGTVKRATFARFGKLAAKYGRRWDASSQTPYVAYWSTKWLQWRQAWADDPASIRLKRAFVAERGLAGLGMWRLGGGDASLWDALESP